MVIPAATGWQVYVDLPPLHAEWRPRVGWGTLPAILLGVLAVRYAVVSRRGSRWRRSCSSRSSPRWPGCCAWRRSTGSDGIQRVLELKTRVPPLRAHGHRLSARRCTSTSRRIPLDSARALAGARRGAPAGGAAVLRGARAARPRQRARGGAGRHVLAATTPVAVLLTLRRLGAEGEARRAAPFLAVGPAAIWMAVSADAMFGAFAAWGLWCLAVAATSRRGGSGRGLGCRGGRPARLLRDAVVRVAAARRARGRGARSQRGRGGRCRGRSRCRGGRARGSPPRGSRGGRRTPCSSSATGTGIAAMRPYGYWVWGDLAALVFSAGPIVGASIAVVVRACVPCVGADRRHRVVVLLVVAAAAASILLADLSGHEQGRGGADLAAVRALAAGRHGAADRALAPGGTRHAGCRRAHVQHLFFTTW